jgi:hypothetical protein
MVVVMVVVFQRRGRARDKHDRDEARRQQGHYLALQVFTSSG